MNSHQRCINAIDAGAGHHANDMAHLWRVISDVGRHSTGSSWMMAVSTSPVINDPIRFAVRIHAKPQIAGVPSLTPDHSPLTTAHDQTHSRHRWRGVSWVASLRPAGRARA